MQKAGSICVSLEDVETTRASKVIHLASIVEQFHKLKKEGEIKTLDKFDAEDVKGSCDVRIYISQ